MHFFKNGGALAPYPSLPMPMIHIDNIPVFQQHITDTVITSLDKPHQTRIHAGGHGGLETELV